MTPTLSGGVDHIHVYVSSRQEAARWYSEHLGFEIRQDLLTWAEDPGGPLTVADATDKIHLALFVSEDSKPASIAFGATANEYLAWRQHLQNINIKYREADHTLCWSLYFSDPDENQIEVTSWDVRAIKQ